MPPNRIGTSTHAYLLSKKHRCGASGTTSSRGSQVRGRVDLLSVYSVITTAHAQRLFTFHTDPDNSSQKGSTADCFTLMERLERKLEVKH